MKRRKRKKPSDNPFADFDTAIKKMSEEWEKGIRETLKAYDAFSLPSFEKLNFPDLSQLFSSDVQR